MATITCRGTGTANDAVPDVFACIAANGEEGTSYDDSACPCDNFVQIDEEAETVTIGDCMTVPSTVPVKQLLNGTMQSPWVRIAFQRYCTKDCPKPECETGDFSVSATNDTIITTGNISQPDQFEFEVCRAAIKAFQYGWGAIGQGNRCKITIVDEKGSSFTDWVNRLIKSPEGASKPEEGVYQMKVQWGWYITGGDDGDICGQPPAPPGTTPGVGQNSSKVICSPTLYFLPEMINVSFSGNKFIYELEGVDLLVRSQEHMIAAVFGGDNAALPRVTFKTAVETLAANSHPPFRVVFKTFNRDTGAVDEGIDYFTRPGTDDSETEGPKSQYASDERPPLATINNWINSVAVMAKDPDDPTKGIGLVANYDSGLNVPLLNPGLDECDDNIPDFGSIIIWATGLPACQGNFEEAQILSGMKAVYVVNGGSCSSVISFNPSIKWHFQLGAIKAGGTSGDVDGGQQKPIVAQAESGCVVTGGRGSIRQEVVTRGRNQSQIANPKTVGQLAVFKNNQANVPFHSIEAELVVQGDPSPFLCSPLDGYARNVGIVYINPYFLDREDEDEPCPDWSTLTESVCNEILTNRAWFIKGVDHQIKEGSYQTTIKVFLPAPGGELDDARGASPGVPTNLGGDPIGATVEQGLTFACAENFPIGSTASTGGAGGDCDTGIIFSGGGAPCEESYT